MESIIHESSKLNPNLRGYTVESDLYGMEDPMSIVRERIEMNRSWMKKKDTEIKEISFRGSRFGDGYKDEEGGGTSKSYEEMENDITLKSEERAFKITGVRKPVAFEVELGNKGRAEKKGGGGFFGGAGSARSKEAKFLKKRENDWKKLREAKNMRVQLLREKKKKIIKSNRSKPLQQRVVISKKVSKLKVEKSGKPKRPIPAFSPQVAGKVVPRSKASPEEEKKEGTPPAKKIDAMEAWAHPPGFRETNLHGVLPTTAMSKVAGKAERERFSKSLVAKGKKKDEEMKEKIKRMVAQQKKIARGREERENAMRLRKAKAERKEEQVRREKEAEMKARSELVKVRLQAFKLDKVMKAKEMQEKPSGVKIAIEIPTTEEKGKRVSPKKKRTTATTAAKPAKKEKEKEIAKELRNSPYAAGSEIPSPVKTATVKVTKKSKSKSKSDSDRRRSTRLSSKDKPTSTPSPTKKTPTKQKQMKGEEN
ncbi:hypothetical protein TrVE_jg14251 [Triparma verrucosa]|uniref:Uncharacterized protein n=1 Tax=Triparma verrucosa TaxID=1606542 RepID=A0A9W7F257_9STRA|nr:hypothetical protein TrVE_jg14251 [Triparma verrucosa]